MRAVIQRVAKAQVAIEDRIVGSIDKGYLILLGVGQEDTEQHAEKLWNKILTLRIFEDEVGKNKPFTCRHRWSGISSFTVHTICAMQERQSPIIYGSGFSR